MTINPCVQALSLRARAGSFLQSVITFFLIVWLLFIAISALSKMRDDDGDANKKVRCRFCCQHISQRVRTPRRVSWRMCSC